MYDHETKSMWSTLKGEPVIGRLVGRGIKLRPLYVVTTTWGQWKADHPDTDVLSLETGHKRDYGEGVAYRDYFATNELMFTVPVIDSRLDTKEEVLALRDGGETLAISTGFLNSHRIFHDSVGKLRFVVLTDRSGANRVYESGDVEFVERIDESTVRSADDTTWTVSESRLEPVDGDAETASLDRVPAHRAFWFGWFAAFPETRLVK